MALQYTTQLTLSPMTSSTSSILFSTFSTVLTMRVDRVLLIAFQQHSKSLMDEVLSDILKVTDLQEAATTRPLVLSSFSNVSSVPNSSVVNSTSPRCHDIIMYESRYKCNEQNNDLFFAHLLRQNSKGGMYI